ncbi:MAG: hypothetical protein J0I47_08200 [Sphingomonas sp.]|uniref:hypothetical protein n=1 Tax=Sphingomonas sp. TaxID=28214 RepID=UPI001ACE913F|nr:hypothetical protein [Sphingomonas sp.]MBN8808204.1 hypothetical protein [Sphingomonas sp.]
MIARRSKPSFASLLRRAERTAEVDTIKPVPATAPIDATETVAGPTTAFDVDPARVRLWPQLGRVPPTRAACDAILRDGQRGAVTVRPVFDDELFEYEAIDGAETFAAIRQLREDDPDLRLLVEVELVDDDGAAALALAAVLPADVTAAFAGTVPPDSATALAERLASPIAPVLLATARQVARAQQARAGDGQPPYPPDEVMRMLDGVGVPAAEPASEPAEPLSLAIADADARSVTFRLEGADELSPETLARAVKAMIDGAANEGFAVTWDADT